MIHPSRLLESPGERLSFDPRGEPTLTDLPPGPAVMLVSAVTDALKTVRGGMVVDAVDRESVARVLAFAVDRAVLSRLGGDPMTPQDLIEAVRRLGTEWTLAAQDDARRPFSAQ